MEESLSLSEYIIQVDDNRLFALRMLQDTRRLQNEHSRQYRGYAPDMMELAKEYSELLKWQEVMFKEDYELWHGKLYGDYHDRAYN